MMAGDILALDNLLKGTGLDRSSENVPPPSSAGQPTPGAIGPQGIFPGVKVPAPKKVADKRAIWTEDEIPDVPDVVEDVDDGREQPSYDILYKQSVGTEDNFLGLSGKDPSSTCCEEIVIKVELPGTASMKELNLDVQATILRLISPRYRLVLPLPHTVDPEKGKARWDAGKQVLSVELPVVRELDWRTLPR